jgi:hypothetical protein
MAIKRLLWNNKMKNKFQSHGKKNNKLAHNKKKKKVIEKYPSHKCGG